MATACMQVVPLGMPPLPVMDGLCESQCVTLDASGLAVGLPDGLMGNSEVGHFTLGTGRVTYQVCHCVCTACFL